MQQGERVEWQVQRTRAILWRYKAAPTMLALASQLVVLVRETGTPVDVLRTFAGISDPKHAG
jgi:hypothetical protein